LNLKVRDIVQ